MPPNENLRLPMLAMDALLLVVVLAMDAEVTACVVAADV